MPANDIGLIQDRLRSLRGKAVILDSHLAEIYGVTTSALNQAANRNAGRFPDDFAFVPDPQELALLMSQNVISSSGHGGRRKPSRVFTEHGALMASTILRSEQATRMGLFVIRAFVRMREEIAANQHIFRRLAEIDRTLLTQDAALRDIYKKLLPLLQPEPALPKRQIGFHPPAESRGHQHSPSRSPALSPILNR